MFCGEFFKDFGVGAETCFGFFNDAEFQFFEEDCRELFWAIGIEGFAGEFKNFGVDRIEAGLEVRLGLRVD